MSTVTINGTELAAVTVIGSSRLHQGQNRKTLEFHFAEYYSRVR